ncbi:MAG: glycosyltransferase, partial [Coraliomargarita sp.]
MKILRVIHTISPESGGPIEGLKQSSKIMTELGVEVEIACLDSVESLSQKTALPWTVHALGPGKFGAYSYAPQLRNWLATHIEQYDAVIIHGNWQYHGLATANACIQHGVPYYIFPHG